MSSYFSQQLTDRYSMNPRTGEIMDMRSGQVYSSAQELRAGIQNTTPSNQGSGGGGSSDAKAITDALGYADKINMAYNAYNAYNAMTGAGAYVGANAATGAGTYSLANTLVPAMGYNAAGGTGAALAGAGVGGIGAGAAGAAGSYSLGSALGGSAFAGAGAAAGAGAGAGAGAAGAAGSYSLTGALGTSAFGGAATTGGVAGAGAVGGLGGTGAATTAAAGGWGAAASSAAATMAAAAPYLAAAAAIYASSEQYKARAEQNAGAMTDEDVEGILRPFGDDPMYMIADKDTWFGKQHQDFVNFSRETGLDPTGYWLGQAIFGSSRNKQEQGSRKVARRRLQKAGFLPEESRSIYKLADGSGFDIRDYKLKTGKNAYNIDWDSNNPDRDKQVGFLNAVTGALISHRRDSDDTDKGERERAEKVRSDLAGELYNAWNSNGKFNENARANLDRLGGRNALYQGVVNQWKLSKSNMTADMRDNRLAAIDAFYGIANPTNARWDASLTGKDAERNKKEFAKLEDERIKAEGKKAQDAAKAEALKPAPAQTVSVDRSANRHNVRKV